MSVESTRPAPSPNASYPPPTAKKQDVSAVEVARGGAPVSSLAILSTKLSTSTINSLCGAMAGVASGIVTCPLDVIKTRLQAQGSFRPQNAGKPVTSRALYHGLIGTARVIWAEDGLRGMYRGLGPMLLGYLPTWAVYMTVYEASKDFYYERMG